MKLGTTAKVLPLVLGGFTCKPLGLGTLFLSLLLLSSLRIFNSSTDKTIFYNKLNSLKGINHQKAIISDYNNIPGVTQGSFVSNAVDDITSNLALVSGRPCFP